MISGTDKSKTAISREAILYSDRDLVARYLGIKTLPCKISSPLRKDDDIPSFSFFEREGKVFWKDFGTGESGDIISLFARLWAVKYNEALLKIKSDTGQRLPASELLYKYKGKIRLTHGSSIQVRIRKWQPWDTRYWEQYGISRKMCKFCNVYPISHAFFTRETEGKKLTVCVPMEKIAYAYFEWKDNKESIKLYQPYSLRIKWLSKHDKSVWDLWKQVFSRQKKHPSDSVILTSSRKDAMCLWENLGIPSMSLQGEGYVPKPHVMQQVLDSFGKVYIWYDNDFKHTDGHNPGQEDAAKMLEMFPSLINVCIPDGYKCKDPSDLYKFCGKQALRDVWDKFKIK